jgi:hypothetical protein
MRKLLILTSALLFAFVACEEDPPTVEDGKARADISVKLDTAAVTDSIDYLPNADIFLNSEYGNMHFVADEQGRVTVTNIPSAVYQISAKGYHPSVPSLLMVGTIKDVEIYSGKTVELDITASPVSTGDIVINELYVAGPVNNFYFFYDQYIELYNSSDSVRYLDGIVVARLSGNDDCGPGCDWGDDGDIDGATYIFKFPGHPGETNYPIMPHEFKVLAQTAYDHTQTVSTSIDLSHADWEFYNQLSASDFDNPDVPNLYNIRMDRTVDFYISLTSDVVIIADGRDTVWADGFDIDTILDGVEYQSSGTRMQTLDDRIDRGWVKSPPKYSGQSMQRKIPGMDTNDGTLDWTILEHPTPGYQ